MVARKSGSTVKVSEDEGQVVEVIALTMTRYTDADGKLQQAYPGNTLRVTKGEAGRLHGGHLAGAYSEIAGVAAEPEPKPPVPEAALGGLDSSDPDAIEFVE